MQKNTGFKNMLFMQAGGKTRLITIGSANMHTSMALMKTGSDKNKTAVRFGISGIE